MRILLTGADGLLGNNLVRELLNRNHKVAVLHLNDSLSTPGLDGLPLQRYYGNILDKQVVEKAISGKDYVIHAAASTQVYPPRDPVIRAVNITGTGNVIEACLHHQVKRLIHVGSAISFAPGTPEHPGDETGSYTGSKYGLDYFDSKYEAQQLVLRAVAERGLDALVVNPTFMIGPYDTKPSSGALILALYHKKVPVYTRGSKTYVAVKDAAVAIVNALTMGQAGECYILGNFSMTYKEACEKIAQSLGVDAPRFTLPSAMIRIYGIFNSLYGKFCGKMPTLTKEIAWISCEDHSYSGGKAREKLLMPCTDFTTAIMECFDWFRNNGYTK
jgi:dihydroflavonol-4-reductase